MEKRLYILNDIAFDDGFIPYIIAVNSNDNDEHLIDHLIKESFRIIEEEQEQGDNAINVVIKVLQDNGITAQVMDYVTSYNLPA